MAVYATLGRQPCVACQKKKQVYQRPPSSRDNPFLRAGVSAVTRVLDTFTSRDGVQAIAASEAPGPSTIEEFKRRLSDDFRQRQYFVTGNLDSTIYSKDCLFADPTISFRGLAKWQRNLRLLVPFFIHPSIELHDIADIGEDPPKVKAVWRLKVILKLPWKPAIDVKGATTYLLDARTNKVVEHVETWDIGAREAVAQIFQRGK